MEMAAALILLLRALFGDLIVTKDGKSYEGEVVEETDDWITVRTKNGDSRIHKDFVERWEKGEARSVFRLRYFVLKGGGVKVGEVVREAKLSITLKLRGGEDRVSRSLIVESAPCDLTPSPSGPAKGLRNPQSHRRKTIDAVYALAFAGAEARRRVDIKTLVTLYLDPLEPHAARMAALELMGRVGARAVTALTALSAAAADRNEDLRIRAAKSLAALAAEPRAKREFDALTVRWLARGSMRERSWAVEAVGSTDVEKRTEIQFEEAGGTEAIRRLAEENALAIEILPAAEKYIRIGKPVTLHLEGMRLILAFRWIARQAGISISVKPGKVCILPGRMTADMSSKDERAQIAQRLGVRIALPGGTLGRCFEDVGRLAGVNIVISSEIGERELSMAGLRRSEGTARGLLEELCGMMRLHWSILDGAVYVRR